MLCDWISKIGQSKEDVTLTDSKYTFKLKIGQIIINHHSRKGGRSELSGLKNLIFNSLLMIKYMLDLRNDIKKSK